MKTHSQSMTPTQVWPDRNKNGPVMHPPTTRVNNCSVVTTGKGGDFVPLKAIPLLREDGIKSSRLTCNVQMGETAEMLLNPVRVSVMAYLVPKLALSRFQDMGQIDRSYNGQNEADANVIPWFETLSVATDMAAFPILQKLGVHAATGDVINDEYIRAYNVLWNFLARSRSLELTERAETDSSIAPAFWEHSQMRHVVPSFDDAMMAGTVPLSFSGGTQNLPVKGIGSTSGQTWQDKNIPVFETDGTTPTYVDSTEMGRNTPNAIYLNSSNGIPAVFAELSENSVEVSIANIDLARETAAWARLRRQYSGMSEDWMIDQLLQGIRFNDNALKEPMLIDHQQTLVGMSQRYATDAANLTKSVVDGQTSVSLNIRVPRLQCGGVVMVVAQALPEMIYERERDPYVHVTKVADLPNRTSDELDPQPVDLKFNRDVDTSHSLPDDLFGYEPLNAKWQQNAPAIGGKYFKESASDPWTEDRNRIWSTEVVDPALGPDFYTATAISQEVFADTLADNFEYWLAGQANIEGLTFFGAGIQEDSGDYDAVVAQVDTSLLKGDGTDTGTP